MGLMRFLVQDRSALADEALARIYMAGVEAIPWRSRAYWQDDLLVIARDEDESGNVCVPWPCENPRELMLSTASLMQRDKPYLLELELARGTLNSVRNQLAAWQQLGLVVPAALEAQLAAACRRFAHAATSQQTPSIAAEQGCATIEAAVEIGRQLGIAYAQQTLLARRQTAAKLSTLFAINLGHQPCSAALGEAVAGIFNAAVVPMGWRQTEVGEGRRDWTTIDGQIEWAQKLGLKICGGPLLQMDPRGIPDWTYLWEGDFDNLLTFMLDHVRTTVTRYKGRVQLWQVAGRVNCGHFLGLDEEQRLRMVVRVVEAVREADPRTPLVVLFGQPWGEYLAARDEQLAPIYFADALARSDLGLSGIGLEINANYYPGGSLAYSLIDYSRQIDRWSLLGLPLMVTVAAPSSSAPDPQAIAGRGSTFRPSGPAHTPESQAEWVGQYLPLLLAKSTVQVLCWNQLRDATPHDLPHGGLLDATDTPKPALAELRKIRQMYLG